MAIPSFAHWRTCKQRNRSHTQTHNKNNTTHDTTRTTQQQHNTRHDKNNTTNDHTKNHPPHLTTIEGGAATVRTTSHTRVGGRTCEQEHRCEYSGCNLAFTRYSFTSRLLCTNPSSLSPPRPPALPTLLKYHCTTIARYTTPPRPPCVCHTPCTIGHGIQCKGQVWLYKILFCFWAFVHEPILLFAHPPFV